MRYLLIVIMISVVTVLGCTQQEVEATDELQQETEGRLAKLPLTNREPGSQIMTRPCFMPGNWSVRYWSTSPALIGATGASS